MKTVLLLLMWVCTAAEAGLFKVINRTYGSLAQAVVDPVFDSLESSVNSAIPDADPTDYLKNVAHSVVAADTGMGADYASPFSLFLLGAKASVGIRSGSGSLSSTDLTNYPAAAAEGSFLLGINGKSFGKKKGGFWQRTKWFASFFTYSLSVSSFAATITSFGLHGQYKIFPVRKALAGWLQWGGVDLTAGLRKSAVSASVTEKVTKTSSGGSRVSIDMLFDGTVSVGANANIYSLPVELTTYGRLGYLFTIYAGLGSAIAVGSSKANASVTGPITITGDSGISGLASLDLGKESGPSPVNVRYLAGLQVELGIASLYAQFTQALTNSAMGLSAGMNLYW